MTELQVGEAVATFTTTRLGNQKRAGRTVARVTARDIVLSDGQRFRRSSIHEDPELGTCYFNKSRGTADSALGLARLSALTSPRTQRK
jgi:hypothetical protein